MPPLIVPYVSGEELLGGSATEADLRDLAAPLPVLPCLMTLSQLSWYWQEDQHLADQAFARFLCRSARRRWQSRLGSRPLVFPERLASAMRAILLHGNHGPPRDGTTARGALEDLARLTMLTADVDNPRQDFEHEDDARSFFHSFLLRQHYGTRSAPMPACTIGRAHRMFVELPAVIDHPQIAQARIAQHLEDACGMPLDRYLAITGTVGLKFVGQRAEPSEWFVDANFFQNARIDRAEILAALEDISATPSQLADGLRRQPSDLPDRGLGALSVFFQFPLCRSGDGRFIPLYPPGLIDRLSGKGVYLRARVAATDRTSFQAGVGRLFETYLSELASVAYEGMPGDVFTEAKYGPGHHGPDLAIRDSAEEIVIIEAGTDNVTFDRTLLRGDLDALRSDVTHIIGRRSRQLARKVGDFRDGRLTFGNTPASAKVWPAVVLMHGFPLGPMTSEMVFREAASASLQPEPDLMPVSVLSIDDFEVAIARLEQRRVPLSGSLAQWHGTGASLTQPLADFILEHEASLEPPQVAADAFRRTADHWVIQLGLRNPTEYSDRAGR